MLTRPKKMVVEGETAPKRNGRKNKKGKGDQAEQILRNIVICECVAAHKDSRGARENSRRWG